MTEKRQINGQKYSIEEIVDNAIATTTVQPKDIEKSRSIMQLMGYNTEDAHVQQYAYETNFLRNLGHATGAQFSGQIGKIDFTSRETIITCVNAYLNRRIHGQHQRWQGRK